MTKAFLAGAVGFTVAVYCYGIQEAEENSFYISFIHNYGFSTNARSTHDYHPFILAQTRASCELLEEHLQKAGLSASGRILVLGYQEDAVPRYALHYNDSIIDDEPSLKDSPGWDFSVGNLFGFMTGFVLQNLGYRNAEHSGYHIARNRIELFHNHTTIMQKHAFGQAYETLVKAQKHMDTLLAHHDLRGALALLAKIWQWLYVQEIRDGSDNQIATQNILFSLYYARHILASSLPIKKIFTGPDITYPIEILPCQKLHSTQGAQEFVQRFIQELVPIDHKKTAYIVASFTDGVGKTTLLSNVRNWLRYGNAFHHYTRCDNSSSQNATFYPVHDDVVLIDLPAHMSHHMIKPLGSVFVDCATIPTCTSQKLQEVLAYAQSNKKSIEQDFQELRNQLYTHNNLALYDDDDAMTLYAKNLLALKRPCTWLPFYKDDHLFLLHATEQNKVCILTPLHEAHSCGLKITEPERMLFHGGLSLPPTYQNFVHNLITELKEQGVERIVLVECMGMYPRTSRETMRLNFILQQMSHIFSSSYSCIQRVYQHCTTPYQLYRELLYNPQELENALVAETTMRWGLYELVKLCSQNGIAYLAPEQIQRALATICQELMEQYHEELHTLVQDRLQLETIACNQTVSNNKHFHTITCFSCDALVQFSNWLCTAWQTLDTDPFSRDWHGLESPLDEKSLPQDTNPIRLQLQSGEWVDVVATIHRSCQDATTIYALVPILRSYWYAHITRFLCPHHKVPVPLMVKHGPHDLCYVIRPCTPSDPTVDDKQLGWAQTDAQDEPRSDFSSIKTIVDTLKEHYADTQRHVIGIPACTVVSMLDTLDLWQLCVPNRKDTRAYETALYDRARLFVRAAATVDMIAPAIDSDILIRKNSREDFIAALRLHERITLPHLCHVFLRQPLWTPDQCKSCSALALLSNN